MNPWCPLYRVYSWMKIRGGLDYLNKFWKFYIIQLNVLMESKGGKKSSSKSLVYEAPLGYCIEDVRPNGGIKKFRSAAYSNCARKPS
ncbi:hypothetical protein K7X08_035993 [Anisodus acutangulus]|uniref:Uncharacterized protein n=2 Tax=Anisodus TaxID=243963 RepID=A0A9Q1L816_9SOLA|nr:hypothetical protein K7X08_035993 [Anisodus acutangulus]